MALEFSTASQAFAAPGASLLAVLLKPLLLCQLRAGSSDHAAVQHADAFERRESRSSCLLAERFNVSPHSVFSSVTTCHPPSHLFLLPQASSSPTLRSLTDWPTCPLRRSARPSWALKPSPLSVIYSRHSRASRRVRAGGPLRPALRRRRALSSGRRSSRPGNFISSRELPRSRALPRFQGGLRSCGSSRLCHHSTARGRLCPRPEAFKPRPGERFARPRPSRSPATLPRGVRASGACRYRRRPPLGDRQAEGGKLEGRRWAPLQWPRSEELLFQQTRAPAHLPGASRPPAVRPARPETALTFASFQQRAK